MTREKKLPTDPFGIGDVVKYGGSSSFAVVTDIDPFKMGNDSVHIRWPLATHSDSGRAPLPGCVRAAIIDPGDAGDACVQLEKAIAEKLRETKNLRETLRLVRRAAKAKEAR